MCFDLDSRPPIDATPGAGVHTERHVLTGGDGNRFLAYSATPAGDTTGAPILGIFGGADDYIPRSEVEAFDEALTDHGIEHEVHVFEQAPHSFFDIKHSEHQRASVEARHTTHRFFDRILGSRRSTGPLETP